MFGHVVRTWVREFGVQGILQYGIRGVGYKVWECRV